jgi:hypothetical protein
VDIRNLNAVGISESESEPKFDADPGSKFRFFRRFGAERLVKR